MIRRGVSYNQTDKKSGGRIGLQKGAHLRSNLPGADPTELISQFYLGNKDAVMSR